MDSNPDPRIVELVEAYAELLEQIQRYRSDVSKLADRRVEIVKEMWQLCGGDDRLNSRHKRNVAAKRRVAQLLGSTTQSVYKALRREAKGSSSEQ